VNWDKIGRFGGLLAGVLMCSLVFAVVGCEPQSHTIQVRAMDLSVAMVGDEDDVILQDARVWSEAYTTEEGYGLDAESRAMAREYLLEEGGGDSEQISRIQAMKMAMLPIHGGAPKAMIASAPRPAPRFRGGGGNKRKKKSSKKKKGGRKR